MAEWLVRTDRYTTTDDAGRTSTLVAEVFSDGLGVEDVKVSTDAFVELLGLKFTKLDPQAKRAAGGTVRGGTTLPADYSDCVVPKA